MARGQQQLDTRRSQVLAEIFWLTLLVALAMSLVLALASQSPGGGLTLVLLVVGSSALTALIWGWLARQIQPTADATSRGDLAAFDTLQHPLLVRLQQEAPGTYHHSLGVASLAEAAARAISANPTLARIGAYYHDVGKLAAPGMFIENIDPAKDPHLRMEPKDSARIIIEHVIDGVRIAQRAGLPERLLRFIPEHTGTTLAYFFYAKAKRQTTRGQEVYKRDFRYPGPKPMSRETAIVMLADTVEAAVRAHKPTSEASLAATIDEVVREKVDDTQLTLSGITSREVTKVKAAFVEVLARMRHQRVKYPRRPASHRSA